MYAITIVNQSKLYNSLDDKTGCQLSGYQFVAVVGANQVSIFKNAK